MVGKFVFCTIVQALYYLISFFYRQLYKTNSPYFCFSSSLHRQHSYHLLVFRQHDMLDPITLSRIQWRDFHVLPLDHRVPGALQRCFSMLVARGMIFGLCFWESFCRSVKKMLVLIPWHH